MSKPLAIVQWPSNGFDSRYCKARCRQSPTVLQVIGSHLQCQASGISVLATPTKNQVWVLPQTQRLCSPHCALLPQLQIYACQFCNPRRSYRQKMSQAVTWLMSKPLAIVQWPSNGFDSRYCKARCRQSPTVLQVIGSHLRYQASGISVLATPTKNQVWVLPQTQRLCSPHCALLPQLQIYACQFCNPRRSYR